MQVSGIRFPVFLAAFGALLCAGPAPAQTSRDSAPDVAQQARADTGTASDLVAEVQSLIDGLARRADDAVAKGQAARERLSVPGQNAWREFARAVDPVAAGGPLDDAIAKWRAFTVDAVARAPLSAADYEALRELAFRNAYERIRRELAPAAERLGGAIERLATVQQEVERAEAHLRAHGDARGPMTPFQPVVPGVARPAQLGSVAQLQIYVRDMKARATSLGDAVAQSSRDLGNALAGAHDTLERIAAVRAALSVPQRAGGVRQAAAQPGRAITAETNAAPAQAVTSVSLTLPAGAKLTRRNAAHELCEFAYCDTTDSLKIDVGKTPKDSSVVTFRWDVASIPAAAGAHWQVTKGGFPVFAPQTAFTVPGLVAEGVGLTQIGSFKFDFAKHKEVSGTPAPAPSGEGAIVQLLPASGSGGGAPAGPVTTNAPQMVVSPEIYSVRIIPVAAAGGNAIAGQASNVIRIVYDPTPKPQNNPVGTWSTAPSGIVVSKFDWVPYQQHEKWPPGCKDAGDDGDDFSIATAWKYLSSALDWVATAWSDAKAFGVDILHAALPFIPKSTLSIAMDGAMIAAGIPPNLPNVDKLMNSGADYLAGQLVEQIPIPDDVAAGLTDDEALNAVLAFKSTLKKEAKKAMLAAAKKAGEELNGGGDSVYCHRNIQYPWVRLSIRNNGAEAAEKFLIHVTDSAKLFGYLNFPIAELKPGEEITIPVALFTLDHMALSDKHWPECDSQLVGHEKSCNLGKNASIWWDKAQNQPYSFTVTGPQNRDCHKESGQCFLKQGTLYTSDTDTWLTKK